MSVVYAITFWGVVYYAEKTDMIALSWLEDRDQVTVSLQLNCILSPVHYRCSYRYF